MKEKTTLLTHEDFVNFIEWLPRIEPLQPFTAYAKPPMSAEAFQFLFKLLFYCALKPIEALKLRKEDFDIENNILRVKTKNKNPIETTIPPIILGDAKKYLANKNDSDLIFVAKNTKKPVGRMIVWAYARDAGRLAGLKVFQTTEKREIESISLLLFRRSYKQFMSDNHAPEGLIELKFRRQSTNRYGNRTLHDLKSFERKMFKTQFNENEIQEHVSWYLKNQKFYTELSENIHWILEGILIQRKIKVLDIDFREKDPEKFRRKLQEGVTYDPKNMQDLAGVRIICFVRSDVKKVCEVIENTFDVVSMKGNEDRNDFSGYSDIQYVCKLTRARIAASEELKPYENKIFEIQVRTILQHAWSEIEHDDIYKNPASISSDLRRRFFLVSNVLESADNELDSLHHKINEESSINSK